MLNSTHVYMTEYGKGTQIQPTTNWMKSQFKQTPPLLYLCSLSFLSLHFTLCAGWKAFRQRSACITSSLIYCQTTLYRLVCCIDLRCSFSLDSVCLHGRWTYLGPGHRSTWARSRIRCQPAKWPGSSLCSSQDASLSACSHASLCTCSLTRSSAAPAEEQHWGSGRGQQTLSYDKQLLHNLQV